MANTQPALLKEVDRRPAHAKVDFHDEIASPGRRHPGSQFISLPDDLGSAIQSTDRVTDLHAKWRQF
jgi:hypothetical protein